jgi:hypothetical protein
MRLDKVMMPLDDFFGTPVNVVIVDAMGDRYSRPTLRRYLGLSKSSYYYGRATSCLASVPEEH